MGLAGDSWKAIIVSGMANDFPPSGPWTGYYLYGDAGLKHRMRMGLTFGADGKIQGEGADDIGKFVIDGVFNGATSAASWNKAYIGMHTVQYAGIYAGRAICGTWTLYGGSGGFWIWPEGLEQSEATVMGVAVTAPVEPILV